MARIGILGGTFNPIHIGHIEIAKAAQVQYHLDEVWFMPNHIPKYKENNEILSGEHRLKMIKIAISGIPFFKDSDFELKREGDTYTSETLPLLCETYPEHEFYFIMGADSLFYFKEWKNPEVILDYANILVAQRNDKSDYKIKDKIQELNDFFGKNAFYLIKTPKIDCSSSEIRKYLKERTFVNSCTSSKKKDLIYYISQEVYDYIIKNNLFI